MLYRGALLAIMPDKLAQGAMRARSIFIGSGRPDMVLQRKVVELYISPRVTKEVQASAGGKAFPDLVTGSAFDIAAGENGLQYI